MNRIITIGVLAVAAAGSLLAQGSTAAKQPQPKSKGEVEALQALFNAGTPDARIKAGDELLTKFADTEFKPIALFFIAASYEQKGDFDKMTVYAERTLEADPGNYNAMLMLARNLAQRTREHDLDKEEKLTKADKYAHQAETALKDAAKPNPQITDDQWNTAKKELNAQVHESLGLSAMVRKKYDVAVTEFKTALENSQEPATSVRLGAAYNQAGKYDEAIAVLDKVMAQPDVNPQIKQFAQAEKVRATQAKNGPAKPATPPPGATTPPAGGTTPPGQVEIKKP